MSAGSVPCRECGRPVPADHDVCPTCGAPVEAAEAAPALQMPLAGSSPMPPEAAAAAATTTPADMRAEASAAAPPTDTPAPARAQPGRASLLADLPFDAPESLAEWLVAVGSGVAALSFLLPWAPHIVNYTSSWGLASLSHLPVLGLLIVTAILAILPNRVATWIRSGVLGLISGSMFLGVLWPYVAGDFGAEFGSITGAAAAVVLIVGGVLAVAPRKGPAVPL